MPSVVKTREGGRGGERKEAPTLFIDFFVSFLLLVFVYPYLILSLTYPYIHIHVCTGMHVLTTGLRGDFGERSVNGLSVWRSLPWNVGLEENAPCAYVHHTCKKEGYSLNTQLQIYNEKH